MSESKRIDLRNLLGFDMVSEEVLERVDFKTDVVDAKLGAKVGAETLVACDVASALAWAQTMTPTDDAHK